MSRHTDFNDLDLSRRYNEVYHDALVALWREQYEETLRTGAPAPKLPREVEMAVIRSARRMRSEFIANNLSRFLRHLTGMLGTAWRRWT